MSKPRILRNRRTLPTVPVSMSDTPEELLQKLSKIEGLATP